MSDTQDLRRYAPAVARNREVIAEKLANWLPQSGCVLEIASGSGEHIVHFATAQPQIAFQPSDPDPSARTSIDAWVAHQALCNVAPAIAIDARTPFPELSADLIVCINMIHISPWAATEGLMRGAASVLKPGGHLFVYGPFRRDGVHTAPTNAEFDDSLRARDPAWGVRDLEDVNAVAKAAGFASPTVEQMPANNLTVVWQRT